MVAEVSSFDISVYRGIKAEMSLVWKDQTGTPIDLTGFSMYMQFRNEYTKELYFDASNYIALSQTPTDGSITVVLGSSITNGFLFDKCGFDLLARNGGNTYVIAKGKVYVGDTLTKIQ